jgi:hypothetical protein
VNGRSGAQRTELGRGSTGRWVTLSILALVLVRIALLVGWIAVHHGRYWNALAADTTRYHQIATAAGRPYRDLPVEFPPLSLGMIDLVAGSTTLATAIRLGTLSFLLDVAVAAMLMIGWGRLSALAYLALGTLLVPFVYFRVDLLSVALAVGALLAIRSGAERSGGVVLALAVLAKLWPVLLAPLFFVERRWRALISCVVSLVVGGALWLWWGGVRGPQDVITFRGARGWQIESTVGAVYRLVASARVSFQAGADRVGTAPLWARTPLLALAATVVGVAWMAGRRAPQARDGVIPSVCVAALLVASPLLSPQYLLWMLPWAAIAAARGNRIPAELLLFAVLLTAVIIYEYDFLVAGEIGILWMALVRNLALGAVSVMGLLQLLQPAPSRT